MVAGDASTLISIVIPAFNEQAVIERLLGEVCGVLDSIKNYQFELIIIDDGSADSTLEIIKTARKQDSRIKFISFTRNFGHQAAIKAGLEASSGKAVITLDADLQHPPATIPKMIESWEGCASVVTGVRADNRDVGVFKRLSSKAFYSFIKILSDVELHPGAADFRLMDRKVVNHIIEVGNGPIFIRGMIPWLGYDQTFLEYEQPANLDRTSHYSIRKMISLALAGITTLSSRPLRVSVACGLFFSLAALLYGAYAIYIRLFTEQAVPGWTSILVWVLLIGGVQLVMLGVLGEYIGKVFLAVVDRPQFIVEERELRNEDKKEERTVARIS